MAEMKLTLQLNGVQNLIQAIGRVNSALSTLNQVLNRTAGSLNAIANKLNSMTQVMPQKFPQPKNPNNPNNPGGTNNSPQDAYSILFSIFSGAYKNVGAKLGTGFLRMLNIPTATLGKFALIAGVAYYALAMLVKGFLSANDVLNEITQNYFATRLAGASDVGQAMIQNIAQMFGRSPEDVAKDVASRPGGINQFIEELRRLKELKGEAKRVYAEARGLAPYSGIDKYPDFERQIRRTRNPAQQDTIATINQRANRELKDSWDQVIQTVGAFALGFKIAFTMWLGAVTMPIRIFNNLREQVAKWLGFGQNSAQKDHKDAARDLKNAAKDLKDAAYATKEGVTGGAERARGALPTSWTWNQSMMINNARNLGAFEY